MRAAFRPLAALLLALWWVSALTDVAAAQPLPTGQIIDFEIRPPTEPLQVGDRIEWVNDGQRPHTITDRGGTFDSGVIQPGGNVTIPLPAAGTYFLFCEINPSRMNATVVVEPGPEPPADVRIQAVDEARDGAAKAFDPPELEVATGTRVILANVGGVPHSMTADDGSFDTGIVEPGVEGGRFHGNSTAVVIDEPGTYAFFCEIHPAAMRGVITVTDERVDLEGDRFPPSEDEVFVNRPPPTTEVSIVDHAFEPVTATVAPGGTVKWINTGVAAHTATFDDVLLDTGTVLPGAEASLTLPDQPGTYSYFCSAHPAVMRAVLVVSPRDGLAITGVTEGEGVAASGGTRTVDGETDGTALAYVLAVLVVGVGVVGLVLGLRKRPG